MDKYIIYRSDDTDIGKLQPVKCDKSSTEEDIIVIEICQIQPDGQFIFAVKGRLKLKVRT